MANQTTIKNQFFDNNGNPLAGGKIWTYDAGTTNLKASYTDATGLVANTNPVILDASGSASIWFNGLYKIVITDSADVVLNTIDNVNTVPPTTTGQVTLNTIGGTGDAITAISPNPFAAYTVGQKFNFIAIASNTGPATININGIGVKAITKLGATALAANDILIGSTVEIIYDGIEFQLSNLAATNAVLAATATSYAGGALGQFPMQTAPGVTGFVSSITGRNRFINGAMAIDQRNAGAAQTFTAGAALAYSVDRWYGYCTGGNVTGQRVAGTAPQQFNYRFTGGAAVSKIGFAQRIEAANSQDLAGTTAVLSAYLANSLLTSVTWTAWYANTADTFGTLAAPTRTLIATGTFTVNASLARYQTTIAIPAAATTGIEIEFSVGAQTSGTWTIGQAQLESGAVATPFEFRSVGTELALCQRYYFKTSNVSSSATTLDIGVGMAASTTTARVVTPFPVTMRTNPTSLDQSGTAADYGAFAVAAFTCNAVPTFSYATQTSAQSVFSFAGGLTTGYGLIGRGLTANGTLGWSAEL